MQAFFQIFLLFIEYTNINKSFELGITILFFYQPLHLFRYICSKNYVLEFQLGRYL